MSDLYERFRTFDSLPEPDLWSEIEARAVAPSARPVLRAAPITIMVVLVLAVLSGTAIVASGILPPVVPPQPSSQTPLESLAASPIFDVEAQGGWLATGAMVRPRSSGHSVTLLVDGRVLVAGGTGGPDAELYDPEAGAWTATGEMFENRTSHTATLLPDGRVLVAGGGVPSTEEVFATAELFDPSTGAWTATSGMTEGRFGHTATLLPDGRVLLAGGEQWVPGDDGAQLVDLASAELYDPATETWTATTDMPERKDVSTATLLLDGRVLFVGYGAQLYDPATESWTATGMMAHRNRKGSHTATLLRDGRVLVAGWNLPVGRRDAELYDPQTNSWTRTGDMIEGRAWFAAGLLADGRVLVTGGGDGGFGGSQTAELYDPDSGTWMLTPNMLSGHGYHEGVTLNDGRFLVVGGFGGEPDRFGRTRSDPPAETYEVGSGD